MSPKTMGEIYFNYLDSTKEESDDVIGCFGKHLCRINQK